MNLTIARKIFKKDSRAATLKKMAETVDNFDEEIEKAYQMAYDALEYQYIPVKGVFFEGNQLFYRAKR